MLLESLEELESEELEPDEPDPESDFFDESDKAAGGLKSPLIKR